MFYSRPDVRTPVIIVEHQFLFCFKSFHDIVCKIIVTDNALYIVNLGEKVVS